jgi:hypothetical protein
LRIGDPQGLASQKSLGAAAEGVCLALSARSLAARVAPAPDDDSFPHRRVALITPSPGGTIDPLCESVFSRASYRGLMEDDGRAQAALDVLETACADVHFIRDRHGKSFIADYFDTISLEVLRGRAYRLELLSWMRLNRSHPDHARDGLNSDAMALSPLEAAGAGIVLGAPMFGILDTIGVAGALISEKQKVNAASAVALFHAAENADAFDIGRRYYRMWLELEAAGLCACPMSVLADVPAAAHHLMRDFSLPPNRQLVTVLRVGTRTPGNTHPRVRLPLDELIFP